MNKEVQISQGKGGGREHNVVWSRIDFSGGRYAYRIHPHGIKGSRAALHDEMRTNDQLKGRTGSSEVERGKLKFGEEYINENFSTKIHGETDGTRHVKKGVRKPVILISHSS